MPDPGQNEQRFDISEAALGVNPSPVPPALLVPGGWRIEGLPGPVRDAGPSAERRLLEFFTTEISNPHTRLAYSTAAGRFFRVVRNPRPGARGHHALCRGDLYRGDAGPLCPPHRQAAPLGPPGAARLPGRGPGPAGQSGRSRSWTQACRQAGQDPRALRRRGPHPCSTRSTSPGPRGSGTGLSWPPWSTPSPAWAPWSP